MRRAREILAAQRDEIDPSTRSNLGQQKRRVLDAAIEALEAPTVTPAGNLLDRLEAVEYRPRPSILAHVMPSELRPGELSLRLRLTDRSWRGFLEALVAEGFQPGDVVRIEAIR
jgi:hypothetical protein